MYNKEELDSVMSALPTSWESMKFSDYKKCIEIPIVEAVTDEDDQRFSGVVNTFNMMAALTGRSFKYFEDMPYPQLLPLVSRLQFIKDVPREGQFKHTKAVKKLEDVTYNEFLEFLQLVKDPVNNMGKLVAMFAIKADKSKYTEDEVNNFTVAEVYSIFFTLNKLSQKSINTFKKQTLKKIGRELIKVSWKRIVLLCKQKIGLLKKG